MIRAQLESSMKSPIIGEGQKSLRHLRAGQLPPMEYTSRKSLGVQLGISFAFGVLACLTTILIVIALVVGYHG